MCCQEFSERPEPQGTGLIFSPDPTAEGFKGILHLPEHSAAPLHVPVDVDLPVLQANLPVGGVGPDPEVGKEPGREIALEQLRGDASKRSRPTKTEGSQDIGLDKLEDADRPLNIRNRPFKVPEDGLGVAEIFDEDRVVVGRKVDAGRDARSFAGIDVSTGLARATEKKIAVA